MVGRSSRFISVVLLSGLTSCHREVVNQSDDLTQIAPKENWKREVLATELDIDVAGKRGTAKVSLSTSSRTGASLEVGDLVIEEVKSGDVSVPFKVTAGRLDLGLPARKPAEVTIRYAFKEHGELKGAHTSGLTFTWPTFCGNLFPCKSDPSDGTSFELTLTNVPAGQVAVYPEKIAEQAPSYMLAWAVGDYTKLDLGQTSAGTRVSAWYLPGQETATREGTLRLVEAFSFYEQTYGPYSFGDEVGSVAAEWGKGAFGGMEHHPFWHVASSAMSDEETHVHEAAHGWFGDGVRIRCWEDLTLSEGTTSYITARAIEATSGQQAGDAVWSSYASRLAAVVASGDRVARPDGCNEVDVLKELWNDVVYVKGAFFYRAVEREIGVEAMDAVLRDFYAEHQGDAAGVEDMLAAIEDATGFDPNPLADVWLRSLGAPTPPL